MYMKEMFFQEISSNLTFYFLENLIPNIVVEMCFILQLLTVEGKSDQENGIVQYTQQFDSYFNFDPLTPF